MKKFLQIPFIVTALFLLLSVVAGCVQEEDTKSVTEVIDGEYTIDLPSIGDNISLSIEDGKVTVEVNGKKEDGSATYSEDKTKIVITVKIDGKEQTFNIPLDDNGKIPLKDGKIDTSKATDADGKPIAPTEPENPKPPTNPSEPEDPTNPNEPSNPSEPEDPENPTNPSEPIEESDFSPSENDNGDILPRPYGNRTQDLDFIFGTDKVAEITLYITREEWNTLLSYYDLNPRNESCVHANFQLKKDDYEWKIKDIGLRLRGNTSRRRPQENENYYQAHFKVDFEEWNDDPEQKLAGCMKGINLKRFKDDPAYVREVFAYNYFRKNEVWTSPRAGYTRLFIEITEDDNTKTRLDYGVYAMIEEINKQFLKERTQNNQLADNKGDLWKCTYCTNPANLTTGCNESDFGVEDISLNESESKRYSYDLKTNKKQIDSAKSKFQTFINELNALNGEEAIQSWYEKNMDIDLFLKTYACNVVLGMDDDYWNNSNNYYIYFDTSGKTYFIPYDYDNCLGTNIEADTATNNPFDWGNGKTAPLITKALEVAEYYERYKNYLMELTSGTFANDCQTEIERLQSLISNYINSPDLTYDDTYNAIYDKCASWCSNRNKYKLLSGGLGTNYFLTKAHSIQEFANPTIYTVTFDANGGTLDGNSGDTITKDVLSAQKLVDVIRASKENFYFDGWYTATDGGEEAIYATSDMTVYAHYHELILPHEYWKDENGMEYIKLTYRPNDFYYDDKIEFVVPACPINDWDKDEPRMQPEEDGTYTYTYTSSEWGEAFQKMHSFIGYKFRINGMEESWLGTKEYKHKLPEEYVNSTGTYDFMIPELQEKQ